MNDDGPYEVRWFEHGEQRKLRGLREVDAWAIYERRAEQGREPAVYRDGVEIGRNTPAANRIRLSRTRASERAGSRMTTAGSVGAEARRSRERRAKRSQ